MPKRNALLAAQDDLERELASDAPPQAIGDLAKSQRMLAEALNKSRRKGYDPAEDEEEDEEDEQQEDEEDERDEEEDEDQNPDDPDADTGVDDERGTTGKPKARKSRRREELEESRRRYERTEKSLRRRIEKARDEGDEDEEKSLRGKLRDLKRSRPAWAGDAGEERRGRKRRGESFDDVYAHGNGSYFENEDADHQEDGAYPPDGPDVADGDDEDVYTIGAHKVRSERAMKRSRNGLPTREALYRSLSENPDVVDAVDASAAVAALVDRMGDMVEVMAKSAQAGYRADRTVRELVPAIALMSKALTKIAKDVELIKSQPVTGNTPWGVPLPGRRRDPKAERALSKSKSDLLIAMESGLRQGVVDSDTYAAAGRCDTPAQILEMLTSDQRRALGL